LLNQQITDAGLKFKSDNDYNDFLELIFDLNEEERAEKIAQKTKEQLEQAA